MKTVPAKTIVTRNKSGAWFGGDYNMNLYRGCCHGCIYCDSRSSCYGDPEFDTVKIKENALTLVANDLRRKVRRGVVAAGSMSDPYNPFEEQMLQTRHALELLSAYGFGVAIATKSPLITRDIDVIKEIQEQAPVLAKITITTADDALCKTIERNVAPSSERFEALRQLSAAGIPCGVLLMPLLPFLNDSEENVRSIVRQAAESGACFVYPGFAVTLRDNQRAYYYDRLDEIDPTLRQRYSKTYGSTYACAPPHAKQLYRAFEQACNEHGLLWRMRDIVSHYKSGDEPQQLSFLD